MRPRRFFQSPTSAGVSPMLDFIKPEKLNWRHYFGGAALLFIIVQLLTGLFLTLFYDPTLKNAYKSVQYITNELTGGSLMRNLHRWVAFSLFLAVAVHTVRSTLRLDFLNSSKRVAWMTGVLLLWPLLLLVYSGLILPWEWKGYWFMEMVPNYAAEVPLVGAALKDFFLDTFTLPRYLVIHILFLPIVCLVLFDYHLLARLRRRGIFRYLARHTIITLPFLAAVVVLALYVTIPSEDPDIIPLPLEGEYIPTPEWYFTLILLPFLYLKGRWVFVLSILIPFVVYVAAAFLPYFLRPRTSAEEEEAGGGATLLSRLWNEGWTRYVVRFTAVTVITAFIYSLIWLGSYNSPTFGCNSCHNLYRGFRMGIPPDDFKDRKKLPNLDDNEWMMGHWFYPTEIY
ncbi:MAG TPA: hypothetical protein ENJ37_01035 [Deltaproteobacteria bacterium]|nr:hypothetical protein [Deltaproteobacteria bacterium]